MQKFYVHVKGQYIGTVTCTINALKKSLPYCEIHKSANGFYVNCYIRPAKTN